jgi:hypothetical protein
MAVDYEIIKVDIVERNLLKIVFDSIPISPATIWNALNNSVQYSNVTIDEMDNWCVRNECGWKESSRTFGFESDEAMNMFLLRWI